MNDFQIFRNSFLAQKRDAINGTSPIPYDVDSGRYWCISHEDRKDGYIEYELLHFFKRYDKYYVGIKDTLFCRKIFASDYKRMLNIVQNMAQEKELTLFDLCQI